MSTEKGPPHDRETDPHMTVQNLICQEFYIFSRKLFTAASNPYIRSASLLNKSDLQYLDRPDIGNLVIKSFSLLPDKMRDVDRLYLVPAYLCTVKQTNQFGIAFLNIGYGLIPLLGILHA